MRLSVAHHPTGIEVGDGTHVTYELDEERATFGAVRATGPALRWTLEPASSERSGSSAGHVLLETEVRLSRAASWLIRCDRVEFPPGSCAYRHTHPGPGIRVMVQGELTVETEGATTTHRRLGAWFESGPEPVFAQASASEVSAFVRVMVLPAEWRGRRTIQYVDPADADRPKLQRATIYLEEPVGAA